jgi:hypothetical protein
MWGKSSSFSTKVDLSLHSLLPNPEEWKVSEPCSFQEIIFIREFHKSVTRTHPVFTLHVHFSLYIVLDFLK